jgi:hypothetical protein
MERMNAVRINEETGTEEYVYCPVCFGELLLGAMTKEGEVLEPEEGKVVLDPMPEGSVPVVICRDCEFKQVMQPEDVFVFEGPKIADPYET